MARNDQDVHQQGQGEPISGAVGRGIGALLAVAVVVGLLFGGGALVLVKMIGLGGNDTPAATDTSPTATLYMPEPDAPATPAAKPSAPATQASPVAKIELVVSPSQVPSMGRVTISGTYSAGIGTVLQVERKEGTSWAAFSGISTTVQPDGSFSTWIQTGRSGENVFRITDQDKGVSSNEAVVTVG